MGYIFSNEYYQYPDLCTCRNPNGRTGLRGRGKLWRWGPNHCVKVVISRWKRFKPQNDFIKVNDKRVMEVIVLQKRASGELTLPEASKLNLFSFGYLVVHVYHSYCLSSFNLWLNLWFDFFYCIGREKSMASCHCIRLCVKNLWTRYLDRKMLKLMNKCQKINWLR